jgi:phosphoribosylamine--glycine ligase / phosphoribosylformylglycinamidine cyclo-ligase
MANELKMRVLLVGSGGREHAIAWKLAQSPRLAALFIAPGNPGTASLGTNLALGATDIPSLVDFAQREKIDLVVIGPEAPLTLGLADAIRAMGIPVFGPDKAAAQIESSKVFAKEFMLRHGIPTARYQSFTDPLLANLFLGSLTYPIVIKASGLASGKGVFLPNNPSEVQQALKDLLISRSLGSAGEEVIIEERLEGEEISLLAFTDGRSLRLMPPAQDHKRLYDNDLGPNTGGMGAYAPAPACPPDLVDGLAHTILQPVVDGLRSEGMLYQGVLYAGLMLTPSGARVLEFNCRFGDPETQAILPLLDSDLLEVMAACANGKLDQIQLKWKAGACACVVAASENYPVSSSSNQLISGLEIQNENSVIFQAGTTLCNGQVATDGGRVLGVTAWAETLPQAVQRAYLHLQGIHFEGMQYRRDIASRGLNHLKTTSSAYASAGVNIDNGNRAVELMRSAVYSTYTPAVLAGIGSFGGLFDASSIKDMLHPVLVASTDGIGTKIMMAAQLGRYASLGHDIVNHCIDDILVQGARPLFFLDYFASARLSPQVVAEIVGGMAEACRNAHCALLGGETAEMPGVYKPGEFDVAGTIVGLVDYDRILPKKNLQAGDQLVGLRSSGPHTNGFSLLRKIFKDVPLDNILPGLERPLGDTLLEPHRSYLPLLEHILSSPDSPVKALAHITGGGFVENLPRVIPSYLDIVIHHGAWPVPPLYPLAQQMGNVSEAEMARVFNLGIGMVAFLAPEDVKSFQQNLSEESWVIGEMVPGSKKVHLR